MQLDHSVQPERSDHVTRGWADPVLACPGEAQPCGSSSTALKWGGDGELSDLDRDRILRLLAAVDPVARELQGQAPEA